jgi:uncharacterized protein (DUF1501 family)
MKQDKPISRRELIASGSTLAIACAVMPKFIQAIPGSKDEFIVVNGWVLKRGEAA